MYGNEGTEPFEDNISVHERMDVDRDGSVVVVVTEDENDISEVTTPVITPLTMNTLNHHRMSCISPMYTPSPGRRKRSTVVQFDNIIDHARIDHNINDDDDRRYSSYSMNDAEITNMRDLLRSLRTNSRLYAEMHTIASRYCGLWNTRLTVFVLAIALLCSIISPILSMVNADVKDVFTSSAFALIGGLNVIFNFLAFQTREQKHLHVRNDFIHIAELIEIAVACASDPEHDKTYDFNNVLLEVQQIKSKVTQHSQPLPAHILEKYASIAMPNIIRHEHADNRRRAHADPQSEHSPKQGCWC
jgi:hypothetical protein